ncbi:MAG: NAD(P)H-binding protein [Acidobacteriota bacterium]
MIDNNQIIVYGGTGFYGQKVVEKLVEKGQSVKVVTRNSENAKNIVGDEVELFQGDVTEKGTIEKSLKNVGAIVICLSAMSNKLIRKMKEIERDDLNGKRIKLTGPKAYSFPEVAKLIAGISGKRIKHMTIPLFLINIVSFLILPFTPFVRFLYKSLKMLNNFPSDLAEDVPKDHKLLRELFDYEPMTLEMEINRRVKENNL